MWTDLLRRERERGPAEEIQKEQARTETGTESGTEILEVFKDDSKSS